MLILTCQKKLVILCYLDSSKARKLDLTSVARKYPPGCCKIAVKLVDIFGNDAITAIEVTD